jgi:hypothetical protein
MGVLGSGVNSAWIYKAGGTTPIAEIETPKSLEWNRLLNEVSDATVDVNTGSHGDCCSIFGKLGTWGHELKMFRDGEPVWEGPITNIKWRRGGVSITAQDPLAWSKKRLTSGKFVSTPDYAEKQAWELVAESFGTLTNHDPNVIPYAQRLAAGTGPLMTRDVKNVGGMYYDQWLDVAKAGAMFTFVGRRLLVWHSAYVMGMTKALEPAKHMSGEVEIEEDGMEVGIRIFFVNDDGFFGASSDTTGITADAFYGLNDLLVPSDGYDEASLRAMAVTYGEGTYPAPLKVNLPQGSVLSCDAPFGINELVAGTLMPVKVETGICRRVASTHQLTGVKVTQDSSGEKVAITLDSASGLVLP